MLLSKPLTKKQVKKVEPPPILKFQGYYEFLSIDYPCWVYYQGFVFPSVATAFQAARSSDTNIRLRISEVKEQEELKQIVTQIKNTPDWPQRRLKVMEQLNRDKFKRNKDLGLKLFATQSRQLVNGYAKGGDAQSFWGAVETKGEFQGLNTLGRLLITIRGDLQSISDNLKWIEDQNVQQDEGLWPEVNLIAERQDGTVDSLPLHKKGKFIFGWGQHCDFKLDQSAAGKFHAAIYFSTDMEVVLVDLNCPQGNRILRAGQQIKLEALRPESLENGDVIFFGSSSTRHILYVSYQKVEDRLNQQKLEAQQQLQRIEKLKQLEIQATQNERKLIQQRNSIKSLLELKQFSCLYVQNINRNYTYKDIKDTFNQYGPTKNIRINIDQKTGRFMGSVLISFEDRTRIDDVLQNIKKHPIKYDFRIVAVTSEEAEKIISTFTNKDLQQKQRKQAEQNQKSDLDERPRIKEGPRSNTPPQRVRSQRERSSSSSSSSESSSSSGSRSRSRSRRRHDRSHNK